MIDRMNKVHTMSTNKVYKSQWTLFEAWCIERRTDPLSATAVLISDFLLYLFKERNLQVKSIEGYRSALTFILKRASGYDLSQCDIISDLIRGFKLERPRRPRVEVQWDISVVLRFLQTDTFKFESVSPRWLTWKALFLVALAAGKRRSELHALERESVAFGPDASSVQLKPHPRFLSKTHISAGGVATLQQVSIPALPSVDPDTPSLCPVRTLQRYIEVSDLYRSPGQRALFVSFVKSIDREISPQTISSYIKQLIVAAYRAINDWPDTETVNKFNIKAHQVRHVAHSLGQLGNLPLSDIIRTGGWTSSNMFIRHYLQHLSNDSVTALQSVGTFVAIENVFQHKPVTQF